MFLLLWNYRYLNNTLDHYLMISFSIFHFIYFVYLLFIYFPYPFVYYKSFLWSKAFIYLFINFPFCFVLARSHHRPIDTVSPLWLKSLTVRRVNQRANLVERNEDLSNVSFSLCNDKLWRSNIEFHRGGTMCMYIHSTLNNTRDRKPRIFRGCLSYHRCRYPLSKLAL